MGIHNRKGRLEERRSFAMGLARRILERVARGQLEAFEGYSRIRVIYVDQSELLEELKPLMELADGASSEELSGNEARGEQMVEAAREWLVRHPSAG